MWAELSGARVTADTRVLQCGPVTKEPDIPSSPVVARACFACTWGALRRAGGI